MNKSANNRHAFLVMAHRDDDTFYTLARMLDHPRNDIFIHMDSKNKTYQESNIQHVVKHSNVFHCPRIKVTWGGYSMIKAELILLKEATQKGHYEFYHLISGQDLPIKKQEYIHSFFDQNQGKEFIQFQSPTFSFESRTRYLHPLQEKIGKSGKPVLRKVNTAILKVQILLKVHRNKSINFQKGANWFSITDGLARYVISKEPWLQKTFKSTKCCDEVFLQTLVANSHYNGHLFHSEYDDDPLSIMRLVDFKRGNPYIYRFSDLEEIKQSECLFARKFDADIDTTIVNNVKKIYE